MIADEAGYEIEYVPYNEEGQVQTSLPSGALDAMVSNPGSILGQVEAGEMNPLLFTGDERLEALADVPTGEEKGITDMPSMPRGLILPPDAPEEAQDWWIDTMKEVVETDGVAGLPRRELPHRGRALGRGLHRVPREDHHRVREQLNEPGHCDHDIASRARRRSGRARRAGPRSSSWLLLLVFAVYTEMAFALEWRTAAGRIGPASSPGSSAASALALILVAAVARPAAPTMRRDEVAAADEAATPTSASTPRLLVAFLVAAASSSVGRAGRSVAVILVPGVTLSLLNRGHHVQRGDQPDAVPWCSTCCSRSASTPGCPRASCRSAEGERMTGPVRPASPRILTVQNLLLLAAGVILGMIVGVMPGLGPSAGLAILLPITFGLDPTGAIVMLAAVYYGAMYGGTITSVLINTPGESATVASTFDGYPLAKQGRAGPALVMAAVASFVAGTIGAILISVAAPVTAVVAATFGPPELFLVVVAGLLTLIVIIGGNKLLGVLSALIGFAIATVGIDIGTGQQRYTFGSVELINGIDFIPVAIGLFGVGEISAHAVAGRPPRAARLLQGLRPWPRLLAEPPGLPRVGRPDDPRLVPRLLRRRDSRCGRDRRLADVLQPREVDLRTPERFGKGAMPGLVGPEAANNAASAGAMVPLLTLGIPGSAPPRS